MLHLITFCDGLGRFRFVFVLLRIKYLDGYLLNDIFLMHILLIKNRQYDRKTANTVK
jgi:hypothetical protein